MTTQKQTNTLMNETYILGPIMFIIAGVVMSYILIIGTLTDNALGTHMVLNGDLTGGPQWFMVLISLIAIFIVFSGILIIILDLANIFRINDSRNRTLTIGSFLLMGTSAFVLALSSITFAAFNWQFFESEMKNGIATSAIISMTLAIIGITASLGYIVFGLIVPMNDNEKLFLTTRNTSMGLVALGWLVFNICINSFGAMGGDANVLIAGLTGNENLLTNLGTLLSTDGASAVIDEFGTLSKMSAEEFFTAIGLWKDSGIGAGAFNSQLIAIWEDGTGAGIATVNLIVPGLGSLIAKMGGLQNLFHNLGQIPAADLGKDLIELGSGKEGMIMGVNNSFNSLLIFILLLLGGVIGLPTYAVLTYSGTSREKASIMFYGSLVVVASVSALYLFLALTPYMVNYDIKTDHVSTIDMLFNGNYGPAIAPGLVPMPGEIGGIHSAVVYFSDEYNGTVLWWIAEALILIIPFASFIGTTLVIKAKRKKAGN